MTRAFLTPLAPVLRGERAGRAGLRAEAAPCGGDAPSRGMDPLTPAPLPRSAGGEGSRARRTFRILVTIALAAFVTGIGTFARGQDDPPEAPAKEKKTKKKTDDNTQVFTGRLSSKDPVDKTRPNTYQQAQTVKLKAGLEYIIELRRTNPADLFDPYLRLEDDKGTMLLEDDDSGGNQNSRIIFTAPADGTYRLVVLSFGAHQEGNYELTVLGRPPGLPPPGVGMSVTNIVRPTEFGDITITPVPQPQYVGGSGTDRVAHGYLEYRFEIENQSAKDARRVTLTMPSNAYRYGNQGAFLRSITKTVEVAPEATLQVSLMQPDVPIAGANVAVKIDGKPQDREIQLNLKRNQNTASRGFSGHSTSPPGGEDGRIAILASPDLASVVVANLYKSSVGAPPVSGSGTNTAGTFFEKGSPHNGKAFHYRMIHSTYSADSDSLGTRSWLGFSPYDGVVLSSRTVNAMPAESRAALWQYVECGGTLVVPGKAKVPDTWKFAPTDVKGCTTASPGFGRCLVFENVNLASWSPDDWKLIAEMWDDSRRAWDQVTSVTDANLNFPVVENLGIPIRGLFTFMFVFVVVIGPLNLFWLSRTNRRMWMLWTVPAISLLTTGLMFAYMALSEGWHAHVRGQALTVLDESSQRASSIGSLGYYSPTTSRGLHFSADTELTPHLHMDYGRYRGNSGSALSIDWTNDQHFDSGWITPKVPLHMMVRRGEKRLERLPARREGDDIVVVNGLKADIKNLKYADKAGDIYTGESIAAGAEARLKKSGDKIAASPTPLSEKFGKSSSWRSLAEQVRTSNDFLHPGTYIAVMDDLPFVDQGLKDTQSRKMQTIVYGISKDAP